MRVGSSASPRKRLIVLLTLSALLAPAPVALVGQERVIVEATVSESVVLPSRFFVGDLVEIRATLRVPSGVRVEPPEVLPIPSWGEILAIEVAGEGVERSVRLQLRPFQPGTLTIPPIPLGEVRLSGLSIFVDSVVGDQQLSLQEPRPQALLPGTQGFVTVAALGLLLLPTIGILLWRGGRRRVSRLIEGYRENRPYRRARRRLKSLVQELKVMEARTFYIELSNLLREYMAQRLDGELLSSTTRELPDRLGAIGLPTEIRAEAVEIYRQADMVKFAGVPSSLDRRNEDLERVSTLLRELHEWKEAPGVGV